MEPIKLGDKVNIKQAVKSGFVQSILHTLNGKTLYSVRYAITTGRLVEDWFDESELATTVSPPKA